MKTDEEKFNILKYRIYEVELAKLVDALKEFELIVIKGWAVSRYYPEPSSRLIGDYDFAVAPGEFDKCLARVRELGLINVDLHKGLRHLDTVSWQALYEKSQRVGIDGGEIRVLSPEDHLRVVCVHWLTDGGEYFEKLWDVYHLVNNRPGDFNWDHCLNSVARNRRRWVVCTIGLAHKFLNLDITDTPIEFEARNLPNWLVKQLEKEWKSEVRLFPLDSVRVDYKRFIQQLFKRFPPNPITATIDCDGDFDAKTRFIYQIRDIFSRIRQRNARK